MRTLNRKLSKSSDGSDKGEGAQEKDPSVGSDKGSDRSVAAAGSGKPPIGKVEGDLEEVREKFRIVKVGGATFVTDTPCSVHALTFPSGF